MGTMGEVATTVRIAAVVSSALAALVVVRLLEMVVRPGPPRTKIATSS